MELVTYVVSGACLGFLIGLTGVGGGVLTVPVLILLVRLDPIAAVGTASLFSVLTKLFATARHFRQQTINLEVALRFLAPSLPGVICTSVLIRWAITSLDAAAVDALQNTISYVIVFSMGVSLVALLSNMSRLRLGITQSGYAGILRILCVFVMGTILGATSIGGGILMMPALIYFYGEKSKYVGTSIFVALVLTGVMSLIYTIQGDDGSSGVVDWRVAGFMALGSIGGSHYGDVLSKRFDPRLLRLVVGAVVLLALGLMFINMAGTQSAS